MTLTNEKEGSIHHSGPIQHGGHKNVVPGAVDEADVSHELVLEAVHGKCVLLAGAHGSVAYWSLTSLVKAPINLRIGVTKLDGDVPLQLVLESDRVYA